VQTVEAGTKSAGAPRQAAWRARQAAKLIAQVVELEVLGDRRAGRFWRYWRAERAPGVWRPSRGFGLCWRLRMHAWRSSIPRAGSDDLASLTEIARPGACDGERRRV